MCVGKASAYIARNKMDVHFIKESIHLQIFPHFKHFANLIVCFFVQNCIRDITDALIAMCEDRQEDEETAMLSNSQIVHSVIDIFGAGERPGVERINVRMPTANLHPEPDVFPGSLLSQGRHCRMS